LIDFLVVTFVVSGLDDNSGGFVVVKKAFLGVDSCCIFKFFIGLG